MIVIDGRRSDLAVKNFENLEQISTRSWKTASSPTALSLTCS
jgi:hypothetical protein